MYARLMHVTLKPECVDTAAALWPDAVGKYKTAGLHAGYMFVIDRDAGKVLSVTIWDSEEACRANEKEGALGEGIAPFLPLFAADPWNEHAEVGAKVL